MPKKPEIEIVTMTVDEIDALQKRIAEFALMREDVILFGKVVHGYFWFCSQLTQIKMTLNKLRKIIFGSPTEKRKKRANALQNEKSTVESEDKNIRSSFDALNGGVESNIILESTVTDKKNTSDKMLSKGHGRIGADAYQPDAIVPISHALLKPGDACPLLCGGKLYALEPKVVIRIQGQSCAHVIRYEFDKLRCALCGAIFTAEAPPDFSPQKYDAHFKANLVMQKYFMASPFYRQERYQQLLGVPLKDSTQWDLVESVADCAYPVLPILEELAANGTHLNHDDTKVKILDVIRANKLDQNKQRKGTFTTGVFAQSDGYKICLYYSGIKHGGENINHILEKRNKHLPPIIQMCDALSANISSNFKTILCHCLLHGRRKFTDIEVFFPEECGYVIDQLALVYKHDEEAKKQNMTADERLMHHQIHSGPVMDSLNIWMQQQFDKRRVEPNSGLGGAIRYMQKHWAELTKFLSINGAHLDNNIVERALKLAIRTRKNAMFHKSLHGAYVAGLLQSLIATCELANKNPIHYLIALQEHKSDVFKNPGGWLPWNYELTSMSSQKKAA